MAGRKRTLVDAMQAVAWLYEVKSASGLSAKELGDFAFDDGTGKDAAEQNWDFLLYEKGERSPSGRVVKLVERAFPGTAKVFDKGVEGLPLWELLSDGCLEGTCFDTLDWWLTPTADRAYHLRAVRSLPFVEKVNKAWVRLVPPQAVNSVDFRHYASGEHFNAISKMLRDANNDLDWQKRKARKTGIQPSAELIERLEEQRNEALRAIDIDTVVGVLALWRIAEQRAEKRSEARYLYDGILPFVPYVFDEWGIGEMLYDFLLKHQLPCDPVNDIIADEVARVIRRHS